MKRSGVQSQELRIALRVLQAYSHRTPPMADDEAYLRKLAGDTTTPGDVLACDIVQAELRKLRAKNRPTIGAAGANKHVA